MCKANWSQQGTKYAYLPLKISSDSAVLSKNGLPDPNASLASSFCYKQGSRLSDQEKVLTNDENIRYERNEFKHWLGNNCHYFDGNLCSYSQYSREKAVSKLMLC